MPTKPDVPRDVLVALDCLLGYIADSERSNFADNVLDGEPPMEHPFFHAAVIGAWVEGHTMEEWFSRHGIDLKELQEEASAA